jgi:hypothetical protein
MRHAALGGGDKCQRKPIAKLTNMSDGFVGAMRVDEDDLVG